MKPYIREEFEAFYILRSDLPSLPQYLTYITEVFHLGDLRFWKFDEAIEK